jgi:transposase InsO family protein
MAVPASNDILLSEVISCTLISAASISPRIAAVKNDQAQFTSEEFTGLLEDAEVRISMDGRGRLYDNIFVERLWRTVKYEEVYLHDYRTVQEAREHLASYFRFYNTERLHETLGYRTPHEIYFGSPVVPMELGV